MIPATGRRDALAQFFAEHADAVLHRVQRQVHAPPEVVEDACQQAWLVLLRRDDITLDTRGRAWIVTVAVRMAWKLADRRDLPRGSFRGEADEPGELAEPLSPEPSCDEQAIARVTHGRRLLALRAIRSREREALCLQALGLSYREIAAATGTRPGIVGHRIHRGRRRLLAGE